MKLLLSKFGGELVAKDRVYSNALHAYNESHADLLKKHAVPLCGKLDLDFKPKQLALIAHENGEHDRYERGFHLIPAGRNLDFKTTPYEFELQNIVGHIKSEHGMQVPTSALFPFLVVNFKVYAFPPEIDFKRNSLVLVDAAESVDSVMKYEKDKGFGVYQAVFQQPPVGHISQMPLTLFETVNRHCYNSLRKKHSTKPSIILPEFSKYNHFWIDKVGQ